MSSEVLLFEFEAMATPCRIRLAGLAAATAERLAQSAVAEVRRIERTYSRYRPDSVVACINAAAGQPISIELDPECLHLLDFADLLFQQSGGAFDITSGVLRQAWDFRRQIVPTRAQIDAVMPLIGWHRVERDGRYLRLPLAGMQLDLGGIGKEYAVDRAASLLIDGGARHGVVNLGGDLRVLGPRPDGDPWQLGVAHPRRPGELSRSWPLAEGALATSGDYERCIVIDGQRHGHILDPRTGWPVNHWQSVSVAAPTCLGAGALATLAMLAAAQAPDLLDGQGVDWLAVDRDGRQHGPMRIG